MEREVFKKWIKKAKFPICKHYSIRGRFPPKSMKANPGLNIILNDYPAKS